MSHKTKCFYSIDSRSQLDPLLLRWDAALTWHRRSRLRVGPDEAATPKLSSDLTPHPSFLIVKTGQHFFLVKWLLSFCQMKSYKYLFYIMIWSQSNFISRMWTMILKFLVNEIVEILKGQSERMISDYHWFQLHYFDLSVRKSFNLKIVTDALFFIPFPISFLPS